MLSLNKRFGASRMATNARVNDALDLIYVLVCRKRAIVEAATHFHHHVLLALCIRTVSDAKGCESDD